MILCFPCPSKHPYSFCGKMKIHSHQKWQMNWKQYLQVPGHVILLIIQNQTSMAQKALLVHNEAKLICDLISLRIFHKFKLNYLLDIFGWFPEFFRWNLRRILIIPNLFQFSNRRKQKKAEPEGHRKLDSCIALHIGDLL